MYDELVKRLRDAAKMSEALAALLPNSDGSATAKLYNEAADAIEELTGFVQEAERDRDEYRERLDKANDTIEKMSMRLHGDEAAIAGMKREIERMVVSGKKPRWIPVTERLPEKNQIVVVVQRGKTWDYGQFRGLAYPGGDIHKWNWKNNTTKTVDYWMPKKSALPEPPKEE